MLLFVILPPAPSRKALPLIRCVASSLVGVSMTGYACLPRQAARARAAFPSATLHWFDHSGHFPMWDMPRETTALILQAAR